MSFYRTIIAAVAAVALASPVFADDTASQNATDNNNNPAAQQRVADATQAPADQSTSTSNATSSQTSTSEAKVNLNTATTSELMKVNGINAARAKAIVSYRKKHGNFTSVDDLAKVKGFKKLKNLKDIQDQVSVD